MNKDFRWNFLPAIKLLRKILDTIEIVAGSSKDLNDLLRGLAEQKTARRSVHFSF